MMSFTVISMEEDGRGGYKSEADSRHKPLKLLT